MAPHRWRDTRISNNSGTALTDEGNHELKDANDNGRQCAPVEQAVQDGAHTEEEAVDQTQQDRPELAKWWLACKKTAQAEEWRQYQQRGLGCGSNVETAQQPTCGGDMDVVSLITPLMMPPMVKTARGGVVDRRKHACRTTDQRQPTWTTLQRRSCGLDSMPTCHSHTRRQLPAAGTQTAAPYTYK